MKLSLAIGLLSSVAVSATASTSTLTSTTTLRSQNAVKKLLSKSHRTRHLEEDEQEEEEYEFLMDYKLKFVGCKANEKYMNEEGNYEYNVALFRLCPADETCDSSDDDEEGCVSGYGEYVVGLNTFVDAYFEDQRENMNDDFDIAEYAECRQYEFEDQDDEEDDEGRRKQRRQQRRRRLEEEIAYYVGPACTEDGSNVKLELYEDEKCSQPMDEGSFEDLSGGKSLPYADGDLISSSCKACAYKEEDDDGAEYEVRELCMNVYEQAGGCESEMESYSANGKDESECEYISELSYEEKSGGGGGKKAIIWILIILGLGGGAYWCMKNRRGSSPTGSVDNTGLMA